MAVRFDKTTIGVVTIQQGYDQNGKPRKFKIQIRQGNCLAVLIHESESEDGTPVYRLFNFFVDAQHMARILKSEGRVLLDDVIRIRLNMYYPECNTLLKYFVRSGFKVTAYYKEPKNLKK